MASEKLYAPIQSRYEYPHPAGIAGSGSPDISDKPENEFAIGPTVRKRPYFP